MKVQEIFEAMDQDAGLAPALTAKLTAPTTEVGKRITGLEESARTLQAKLDEQAKTLAEQAKTLAEQKVTIDGFQAADTTRAKAGRLETALAESDLRKKHAANTAAVTETFRTALLEAAEDKWPGMITDRVALLDGALKAAPSGGPAPKSEPKTMVEGTDGRPALPEGAHMRLLRAVKAG